MVVDICRARSGEGNMHHFQRHRGDNCFSMLYTTQGEKIGPKTTLCVTIS